MGERNKMNTKLEKKMQKEYGEFCDAVQGLSASDLEAKVLEYTKESERVLNALKTSQAIKDAAANLKELKAPYTDGLKAIKLKVRYMLALSCDKGGAGVEAVD